MYMQSLKTQIQNAWYFMKMGEAGSCKKYSMYSVYMVTFLVYPSVVPHLSRCNVFSFYFGVQTFVAPEN